MFRVAVAMAMATAVGTTLVVHNGRGFSSNDVDGGSGDSHFGHHAEELNAVITKVAGPVVTATIAMTTTLAGASSRKLALMTITSMVMTPMR